MESENKKIEETKKKWQKSYFDVLGICCTSEIPLIENILKNLEGIKEYSVIVPTRTVIVVHDSFLISPSQIVNALNQARLEATVKVNGKTNFKNKWPNPFAVVSGVLLLLSTLKFIYSPFRWLAVVAVAAGIYPILAKAFVSIKRFRIDINILIIITVIATLAMQDYMEAAAVVFLFTIADWLESRASYKANSVMQSLMSLAPQKAVIAETGEEVEVDEIKINTILAVKAGETVPIDGIVMTGNCEIDEKTLTGEAFPVPKQKDSTVWAGTMNLNGYISMKTTALAQDCVVAKMAKLVEEAQTSKTKSQRFIDKCSQYYTPAIIVISACIAIVPAAMKVHNLSHWFHLALVVLVSGCPCGLILSTPVATFCALTKAATSGLLIKSADCLDTLSKIKIIAFDKTGTITRGEFIVVDFMSLSKDISLRSLLYWVSSVESKSSHPMATTLVEYAKSVSVEPKPDEVEDYQSFPGEGIYGKINGNNIYIGNKRLASRAGCLSVPDIDVDIKGGKTIGYVYVGQKLAGVFKLSDACRSGVVQAMKELKSLGIKTAMLTGDNQAAAMHAQEQLENSLDVVNAELLPEDKSKIIEEFKREGPTAMVGDGVNDAPALATANIGISMGISGSALATQTGDVILMSNDIRRIPQAIKLARKTHRKVIENVFISISLKAAILGLAFAGHPLIWAAVLVDVGTCLLVILNSMLLLQEKNKNGKKCYRASTSVLNKKLLEADDDDCLDLEAGLLRKTSNDQCNSGCCGNKKGQEKVMRSTKTRSDHCQLSSCCDDKQEVVKVVRKRCCGEKTQKLEGDIVSLSSCKKVAHVHQNLTKKRDLNSDSSSGCCGNKAKEIVAISCCDESDGLKKRQDNMKSTGDCRSHHCGKKEQVEENVATQTKAGENCKSSCCDDKENKVKEPYLLATEDTSYLEKGMQLKDEGNCRSSCCESEKQIGEITVVASASEGHKLDRHLSCSSSKGTVKHSCHEKPVVLVKVTGEVEAEDSDLEKGPLRSKDEGNCNSSCCEGEITVVASASEIHNLDHHLSCSSSSKGTVKHSCHEKPVVLMKVDHTGEAKAEDSDSDLKNEGESKLDCCSVENQTSEITLASDQEDTDCSLVCCSDEDKKKQICHEKPVCSEVVDLDSDCKSICCGNTDEACEGISIKQKGCTDSANMEDGLLQIKVDDMTSKPACCSSDKQETVKVSNQSCCTTPHQVISNLVIKRDEHKELSCCEEKTLKACKSIFKEREIRHRGKSCCRSYAKECCSHRHHHHHHHHHHHVSAAAGF